jgi:hypothetical protein
MASFCTACGKELPEDAKFCLACGTAQGASASEPQVIPPAPKKSNKGGCLVVLTVLCLVFMGLCAFTGGNERRESASTIEKTEKVFAEAPVPVGDELELKAFSWTKSRSYATVEGLVRNISGVPIDRIQAVAIMSDASGQFVLSSSAMIEYQPLLASQESPFRVMVRWNPAMKGGRVEFKRSGQTEINTLHTWKKD